MADQFWHFVNRNGDDRRLYPGTHEGFLAARELQDEYNGCTVEDAINEGWDVSGSEEEGRFSIDDGGRLELLQVEETE